MLFVNMFQNRDLLLLVDELLVLLHPLLVLFLHLLLLLMQELLLLLYQISLSLKLLLQRLVLAQRASLELAEFSVPQLVPQLARCVTDARHHGHVHNFAEPELLELEPPWLRILYTYVNYIYIYMYTHNNFFLRGGALLEKHVTVPSSSVVFFPEIHR